MITLDRIASGVPYLLLLVGALWLAKCLLDRNHKSLFGHAELEAVVGGAVFVIALWILI